MSQKQRREAVNGNHIPEQPATDGDHVTDSSAADAGGGGSKDRSRDSNDPARPVAMVDARGLKCPLPVVRAMQRMAELAPESLLMVKTTDPEAPVDMAAWCGDAGHELVSQSAVADGHEFLIRKART